MFSMRLWVVALIFCREIRDQLRDRRTLFMVFILPILLYPMLGLLTVQLSTAFAQQLRRVIVLGADRLPAQPPLLNEAGDGFAPSLFVVPAEAPLYEVIPVEPGSGWDEPAKRSEALRRGDADVVLLVPPGLATGIAEGSSSVRPELFFNSGDERSRDSFRAVRELLDQWNQTIVKKRLERDQKPESYLEPIAPQSEDVSQARGTADNVWSRMFPFLLVMMSLTGAFYPAVDLCAGEKERGTMETLLITPASRPEIVTGKFLTVWAASIATALVNLLSMGITAWQLAGQAQPQGSSAAQAVPNALSMPGFDSLVWMLLVLLPLSAFFSALCVALAAMARSMKEGQYYLTPLYLITIPLVFATLAPGITLNLFTSLIPVTGASLLLRSLIKGDYLEARTYFLPVLLPLLVYAALALRWAVDQFRSEAVLFRESERFDLAGWMRHVIRDRGPFPSSGEAFFAFALMLATTWFGMRSIAPTWVGLIQSQLFFIALPILILTFLLTSSPARTLLLRWPDASHLALAFALAISLNPVLLELRRVVEGLFPIPEMIQRQLSQFTSNIPDLPTAIFVLALVPAVCEELAFRGFILQGLRTGFRKGSAVVLSAFLFGFLHVLISFFQQLFNATLLGLLLGLFALRSASLIPCILFHFTNNALAVLIGTKGAEAGGLPAWLFRDPSQGLYHVHWVIAGAALSLVLIVLLWRSKHCQSQPETHQHANASLNDQA